MLRGVSLQIRNDREVTGALDRSRKLALVARAGSAEAARKNLALVGDEAAEGAVILVIDPAYASFAERAALLWSSHCRLILVVVVIVTPRCLHGELFFTHRRSADFVLVQRDEVADDAIVELERALELGKNRRVNREA